MAEERGAYRTLGFFSTDKGSHLGVGMGWTGKQAGDRKRAGEVSTLPHEEAPHLWPHTCGGGASQTRHPGPCEQHVWPPP